MILHVVEAGAGSPVALLHGLFGAARNFGALQRRLAGSGRIIALDLRDHGASPHDTDLSYQAMARDVLDTLAGLEALPAALLGHSMGGKVAMRAALDAPALVTRLVVADIAPVSYPPAFRELARAMLALELPPGSTRESADAALAGAVPDPGLRAFLLQNLLLGETPGWRIGLSEIAAALPGIEGWEAPARASYAGPTLFVAGARSDYITAERRPTIRALFPAARFVTLKDAGHWLHADNPDGFASIVEPFLSRS